MINGHRFEDTPIGRAIYFGPLIGSVILTLISVGGFIATVRYMGVHQDKQDSIIEAIQKTQIDQMLLNTKLAALQQTTESRLSSIEDWRNGVSDIYINRHRR
jgi:hypothetical protein